MNPLRVVLVRNAAADDFGGAERFTVFLAEELTGLGHKPVVLSAHKQLREFSREHGVEHKASFWLKWQNYSGWRIVFLPFYLLWQVVLFVHYIALFHKLKADIIHLQSRDDFIAGTLAGKLLGRRVIWTDHADLKHIWANISVWYKNIVGKIVLAVAHYAHTITVVSQSEKQLVAEHLTRFPGIVEKLVVVYNGTKDRPELLGLALPNVFTFCMSGRLVSDKGVSEAVQAFAKFHTYYPNTQLLIVGDGKDKSQFEQHVGTAPVSFLGHQTDPLQTVASSHVYIHPTYHEGFSVSLVEASMLSLPIVATNVGGNPEIINNEITGLLVLPKDIDTLFHAMRRMYVDTGLRTRLGVAAREQYLKKFVFKDIIEKQFIPLYIKPTGVSRYAEES